ncbi:MAG: biopolymer transporter ExbD, partial [candidate division Zixibacteria bacterium]|nr:biopolymer transporter ExbD [candidate division Zixibacteria bacterium]
HNHWRVVYFHHPAYSTEYSSGGHGSNSYMQWDFIGWGAHVVLAGHAHKYERLFIGSLTYFVNGLGGRDTHSSATPISGSEFIYGDDFGAQLVTVDGVEMTSMVRRYAETDASHVAFYINQARAKNFRALVVIKADEAAAYGVMQDVMEQMQKNNLTKFQVVTDMKIEEE